MKIKVLGILGGMEKFKSVYNVYDIEGLSPTITTSASHGNGMPFIFEKKMSFDMTDVKVIGCMDNTMDNTFESANRVYDKDGLCPTIPTGARAYTKGD